MNHPVLQTSAEAHAVCEVMRAVRALNEALETAARLGIRFDLATEMHPISLSRATSDHATVSASLHPSNSWSAAALGELRPL